NTFTSSKILNYKHVVLLYFEANNQLMAGSESSELFVPKQHMSFMASPEKEGDKTYIFVTFSKSFCGNILSHPFTILRRQCQVHGRSSRYHIIPITMIRPCYTMYQRQGISTFWKGLGSATITEGLNLGIKDFLSKVTPWPKEVCSRSTPKNIGQHFMLFCVSTALATPFIAASLVELVQSEIASEKPGIFDIFKEGFFRLTSWTAPQTGRLLPIWVLILPSVITEFGRYVISLIGTGISEKILKNLALKTYSRYGVEVSELTVARSSFVDLGSWIAGRIISDVAIYPFDTVVNRLYLQGTRTIIDNLDDGISVVPIVTRYEGFWDCWRSIIAEEGRLGLYKGFGALVLQYGIELMFLRGVQFLLCDVYGSRFHSSTETAREPTVEVYRSASVEPSMEAVPSTSLNQERHMWKSSSVDFPITTSQNTMDYGTIPGSRPSTLSYRNRQNF
ncbi:hypothetical protein QYM36_004327, partial [Artemia franciscana]